MEVPKRLGVLAQRGGVAQVVLGVLDGGFEDIEPIPPLVEQLPPNEYLIGGNPLPGGEPARLIVALPM